VAPVSPVSPLTANPFKEQVTKSVLDNRKAKIAKDAFLKFMNSPLN
jgi:hypothetical protein